MSSHPNFYYEKPKQKEERVNTNPRYRFYRQSHMTAGDCEQFMQYWKYVPRQFEDEKEKEKEKKKEKKVIQHWPVIYRTLSIKAITDTFHYLFHEMKKGIFVSIRQHQLHVFLPFSKMDYQNSWGPHLKWDRKEFPHLSDMFKYVCIRSNIPFDEKRIHTDLQSWYANNGLIRYEYPPTEGDSGVNMMHDMLLELCASHVPLPDIDFFLNKRDFPLLRKDRKEAYENLYRGMKSSLSNSSSSPFSALNIDSFVPILSMTTTADHADLPIPTWEDWSRASYQYDRRIFSREYREYPDIPVSEFSSKIPTAVFRGASTGLGVNYRDNPRLFFSKLSLKNRKHFKTQKPYLDCGITKWNLRPRKKDTFLETIGPKILDEIPLISSLSPLQQSHYKYILHLPGHSCAYRLSLELSMNSVIIMYPCRYKLWYMSMLKPYVHYVPIVMSEDGHVNIYKTIDWCIEHEEECERIAKNARAFYEKHLGREGIFEYWSRLLFQIEDEMKEEESLKSLKNLKNLKNYSMREYQKAWQEKSMTDQTMRWVSLLEKECPEVIGFFRDPRMNLETWKAELHRTYADKEVLVLLWKVLVQLRPDIVEEIESRIVSTKVEKTSPRVKIWKWKFGNQTFCCKQRIPDAWDEESIHENYIHSFFLSRWQKRIPNFIQPFAVFPSGLKIMEWIEGPSVESLLTNVWFKEAKDAVMQLVDLLKQIVLALHQVQMSNGFMHLDLYPWNVMVSMVSTPQLFEYMLDGKRKVQCHTKRIPIMVDVAKSFVIDAQGRPSHCIEPFVPSPLHDMKCIVFSSLHLILSKLPVDATIIPLILPMIEFFNPKFVEKRFSLQSLKKMVRYHKKFSVVLFSDTACFYQKKSLIDFFHFLHDHPMYRNRKVSENVVLSSFEIVESVLTAEGTTIPFPLYEEIESEESALSMQIKMLPWYRHHYGTQMERWKKKIYDTAMAFPRRISSLQSLSSLSTLEVEEEEWWNFHSMYFQRMAKKLLCKYIIQDKKQRVSPECSENSQNSQNSQTSLEMTSDKEEEKWKPSDSVLPLYASHVDREELNRKIQHQWKHAIFMEEKLRKWKLGLWHESHEFDEIYEKDTLWMMHLSSAPVLYSKTFLDSVGENIF